MRGNSRSLFLEKAYAALTGASESASPRLRRRTRAKYGSAIAAFARKRISSNGDLVRHFASFTTPQKSAAIYVFAWQKYRGATRLLFELLQEGGNLAVDASIALGVIGGDRVAGRLCRIAAQHADTNIRVIAMETLGYIAGVSSVHAILVSLQSVLANEQENLRVRAAAIEALATRLGAIDRRTKRYRHTIDSLVALLDHESSEMRASAAYTLGQLKVAKALPRLRALAQKDHCRFFGTLCVSDEAKYAVSEIRRGTRKASRVRETHDLSEDTKRTYH